MIEVHNLFNGPILGLAIFWNLMFFMAVGICAGDSMKRNFVRLL